MGHSEGMFTRNEELFETMCKSVICVRNTWIFGCDANMEPEELSKRIWFQMMGAVTVATEGEAGTCRANVAGSSVARNF